MLLPLLMAVEAIHLRFYYITNVTGDFEYYLNPWVNFIRQHGFLGASDIHSPIMRTISALIGGLVSFYQE
jgi:hypothetical protein